MGCGPARMGTLSAVQPAWSRSCRDQAAGGRGLGPKRGSGEERGFAHTRVQSLTPNASLCRVIKQKRSLPPGAPG